MTPDARELLALFAELAVLAVLVRGARRLVDALAMALFREERWLWIALVAAAEGIVVTIGLGTAGVLTPTALLVVAAFVEVAFRRIPMRASARGSLFDGVSKRARGAGVAAAAAIAAPFLARALFIVPVDWDGLTYHLFYAANWVREGRLVRVDWPYPHDAVAWYPPGGDLLHALAMAIVRSDLLVRLENFVWVPAVGIAAALIAERLGASARARLATALLASTTPALASWTATAYVDPLVDAAIVGAISAFAALVAGADAERTPRAVLAGFGIGVAIAAKLVALPLSALVGAGLLVDAIRRRAIGRRALAPFASFVALAAVVGAFPYVRNAIETTNPLFPVPFAGLPAVEDKDFPWRGSSIGSHLAAGEGVPEIVTAHLPPPSDPRADLGLGWKAAVLAGLGAISLLARLAAKSLRRGVDPTPASALVVVALAALTLGVGYLTLPFWNNPGWLRLNVRFAIPAATILLTAGIAALDRRVASDRLFGVLVAAGLALDATTLPLAVPGALLSTLPWLLLPIGAVGVAILLVRNGASRRLAAAIVAAAAIALLFVAWREREANRFDQWARASEPYASGHVFFAEAARFLDEKARGRTLAYATDGPYDFAYLFCGRRLERRVVYAAVNALPPEARFHSDGEFRKPLDRVAWRKNLAGSGAELLATTNWGPAGTDFPPETAWAVEAGFREIYRDDHFRIFEVPKLIS